MKCYLVVPRETSLRSCDEVLAFIPLYAASKYLNACPIEEKFRIIYATISERLFSSYHFLTHRLLLKGFDVGEHVSIIDANVQPLRKRTSDSQERQGKLKKMRQQKTAFFKEQFAGRMSNLFFQEGQHYLEHNGDQYALLSRHTRCFTRGKLACISTTAITREVLLFDSSWHFLDQLYRQFKIELADESNIMLIFEKLHNFIRKNIFQHRLSFKQLDFYGYRPVGKVVLEPKEDSINGQADIYELLTFLRAGQGVCRHIALTTCYFLDRLRIDKLLPQGDIHYFRNTIRQDGSHAWAVFVEHAQPCNQVFIIDAAQPIEHILLVNNLREYSRLLNWYSKAALLEMMSEYAPGFEGFAEVELSSTKTETLSYGSLFDEDEPAPTDSKAELEPEPESGPESEQGLRLEPKSELPLIPEFSSREFLRRFHSMFQIQKLPDQELPVALDLERSHTSSSVVGR